MSNKMWGGRFATGPSQIMEEINPSIAFDKRLYAQDIQGSVAHCQMLAATGIISAQDGDRILHGLDTILSEIEAETFEFKVELEDIHMNVEARLTELIGPAAGRLHTGRSRNDQVATDFKLYVRDSIDTLMHQISGLQRALAEKARTHADTIMPGFTHLQSAQPVTFGHHCLAYVEMFGRDFSRFEDARKRLNQCPLGTAALAGTSFPIDREMTAKALGFDAPTRNSMDTVADRDFALEALSAATITGVHLSRLAEEIILWCSAQFGFIKLSDALTTGSSIMPQKRNPDAAELVRGKIGRIAGALTSLITMLKGLALTFSKDMQEDKEPTFDALDTLSVCLGAMTAMIDDMVPDKDRMRASATLGFSTATDLADWLVRSLGLPFRDAHHITGALVAAADAGACDLADLTLEQMRAVDERITDDVFSVLTVENSVASRTSFGGTAPDNVKREAERWLDTLRTKS